MAILRYLKEFRQKIKKYLEGGYVITIKWILRFSLSMGLLLACLADLVNKIGWWPLAPLGYLLLHFGTALIIASIIGFFLEITEIKDFFEERLINILFKDKYIESINKERLIKLNLAIMKGIGKLDIKNSEYEYDDFVKNIQDGVILANIGEIYRKNFQKIIHYSILEDDEIIQELEATPDELKLNGRRLVRIKTTTRFQLIAPREDEDQKFNLVCGYELKLIHGLKDPSKQFSFELWLNEKLTEPNETKNPIGKKVSTGPKESKETNLSFEYKYDVPFALSELYTAQIEYKTISYEYDDLSGTIKKSMNTLTHRANIIFSSSKKLEFVDAEFYGLTGYDKPAKTPNSISIDYSGWALPEDGYFINWREKIV